MKKSDAATIKKLYDERYKSGYMNGVKPAHLGRIEEEDILILKIERKVPLTERRTVLGLNSQ